jgi:hypothetical protein
MKHGGENFELRISNCEFGKAWGIGRKLRIANFELRINNLQRMTAKRSDSMTPKANDPLQMVLVLSV